VTGAFGKIIFRSSKLLLRLRSIADEAVGADRHGGLLPMPEQQTTCFTLGIK